MLDTVAKEAAQRTFVNAIENLIAIQDITKTNEFCQAAVLLSINRVWTTGMGKAGLSAHKLASTLASNGRPAAYIHAGEALHGDFGAIQAEDTLVAISNSGKTEEVLRVATKAKQVGAKVILITGEQRPEVQADVTLCYGKIQEACSFGLTPTTSIVVILTLCDALCMAVQAMREVTVRQYAINHHAGYLGQQARENVRLNES